ncbi:MAG: HD domain-containing protein [Leptolyngbya sp. SIO3F4]|nr:HD domain-containing protein [Leptolyngbya sp. SIO3F4]
MMTTIEKDPIKEVSDEVGRMLREDFPLLYSFHDYGHTLSVVKAANILSFYHDLTEQEKEVLILSAWLHDIGYLFDNREHEEAGAHYALHFLLEKGFSQNTSLQVRDAIRKTKLYAVPETKVQMILKDADLYHLSQPDFFVETEKLRLELYDLNVCTCSKEEWIQKNLDFMEQHRYYSEFASNYLTEGKLINMEVLKKKINAG